MPRRPPAPQTLGTVLIADDEPSMRLLVHTTIESDSYGVLEAADGHEAWALIKRHRPSLVLLDIQMPGRTGLEILASIRSDPSLDAVRVMVMTARALEADRTAAMAAGADYYLTKPFSPLELLARVQEALGL
jgi:two-component system phosphate regulon response regulator PhoB